MSFQIVPIYKNLFKEMNYLHFIILFAAKNADSRSNPHDEADPLLDTNRFIAETTVSLPKFTLQIDKNDYCVDSANYLKVSEMPYYIDKTAFIRNVMEDGDDKYMEFCAPKKFGKSTFLSMLRSFLSIETNENGQVVNSTPEERFKLKTMDSFKNKSVFKDEQGNQLSDEAIKSDDLFLKHFGNHPVISADFSGIRGATDRDLHVKLYKGIVTACRDHAYIFKNKSLWFPKSRKKHFFDMYCRSKQDRDTALTVLIPDAYYELSRKLYEHFGRKVIMLIDEVDAPTTSILYNGNFSERNFTYVDDLIKSLLTSITKDRDPERFKCIEKVIATSVLSFRVASSPDPLFMNPYRFLQNAEYESLFGFTRHQVQKIIENNDHFLRKTIENYDPENFLTDTAIRYNGYKTINGVSIFNPWSVVNAVTSGRSNHDWPMPIVSDQEKFVNICIHPRILPTMWQLLAVDNVQKKIEYRFVSYDYFPRVLLMLREMLLESKIFDASHFFIYLCECGFLSCRIVKDQISMEIPNYEVHLWMHRLIFSFHQAQASYAVPSHLMAHIGETFKRITSLINNGDRDAMEVHMTGVEASFKELADDLHSLHIVMYSRIEEAEFIGVIRDSNPHPAEHIFKWALYVILKEKDGTQDIFQEQLVRGGRIDIVLTTTHKVTFIIGLKYGGNSTEAIKHCIKNTYPSILLYTQNTTTGISYVIMGINFRRGVKKTVDISYLIDSIEEKSIKTVSTYS
ncbi:uncharacterized protein LOC135843308 [Planococcus citri]|uniref:uncharacterized protein LOC135843308 n=1 Tax=Planococcus citri TaxID=170843 RepID=UPI0031F8865A